MTMTTISRAKPNERQKQQQAEQVSVSELK